MPLQPPGRHSRVGRMYWDERVYLLRKAADLIDQRLFEISAVVTLEVGKNRMEALGMWLRRPN
jgi:acyl-CoA reductase-like NAD-dependent aldehyde dehydrogenase